MRLLLVRHGRTPSNLRGVLDTGVPGPGLTDEGLAQADALPSLVATLGSPDALYASTLVRTQMTVAPLAAARGLGVHVRDGLREVTAGELEMRGDDDAVEQYLATIFTWASGDPSLRMPGGESGTEVLARFDAVVEEAAASGAATVAMVSHGAMIRGWSAARADNVRVDFAARNPLGNTGVVVLEGGPGRGWTALSWEGAAPAAGAPEGRP